MKDEREWCCYCDMRIFPGDPERKLLHGIAIHGKCLRIVMLNLRDGHNQATLSWQGGKVRIKFKEPAPQPAT